MPTRLPEGPPPQAPPLPREDGGNGDGRVPHWSGLSLAARWVLVLAAHGWALLPWGALVLAGESVSVHRWPGGLGLASAALSLGAALGGHLLLWKAFRRDFDLSVAEFLDAPGREPRAAAHAGDCLRRHGVSPRSSGWGCMAAESRCIGRRALLLAGLLCAPVALHSWWWG